MMKLAGRFNSLLIQKLRKFLAPRGFLADRAGTTAVEFAMISVPFLGLIGAIFETGSVYFRTAQLQMATEYASRAVLTHSTDTLYPGGLTYQQFRETYVCPKLSGMFNCSKIMVDVRSPIGWNTANTANDFYNSPNPDTAVVDLPPPGQIAIVRVAYPTGVISGFFGGGVFKDQSAGQIRDGQVKYNSAWTYMLMGIVAFRVEP